MKKVYPILVVAFSLLWVSFILLDYLQKHPQYAYNIYYFQYWDLFALVFAQAIGGGLVFHFFKNKISTLFRGGLLIIPGIILVCTSFALMLTRSTESASKMSEVFFILGNYLRVALQVFFIILAAYSIGNWLVKKTNIKLKSSSNTVISIGTGIMTVVMLAFILGVAKGLYWFTLGPVLIACIGINYKQTFSFLKHISIAKLKPSKALSVLGASSLLLLLFMIQFNLLQNISPFPKGWDSLSLYVKLPTIINDYHGLVRGYQPYNWSLLMSFGMILFNSLETVLALSYVGGVLCLLGLYAIGKDILKMDQNYVFLSLLTFYLIPSVAFQSFQEQKVDLGLLFIVLSIVILLFHWIMDRKDKLAENENAFSKLNLKTLANPYLILMGLLTGFAFGIKLTTLFTYFSIISIVWFIELGYVGFLGSSMLCCFAILLVKLDDMSGMRAYHLSANYVQWTLLLIGLSTFGYLIYTSKQKFIRSIIFSAVYTAFFGLMASPWITKNFIDSDMNISFRYMLNGKTNEPPASLNYMKRKYDQALKKQNRKNEN